MKSLKTFIFLIVLAVTACSTAQKQGDTFRDKPVPLDTAVNELTATIADSPDRKLYARMAVMPITSAASTLSTDTKFGKYLSDKITGLLKENRSGIRLFERNRLKTLMKEHELALSGLISGEDAVKMGEFIPVDAVLTGSYTKFTKSIELNCRLISVTSGEIIFTFNRRIILSEDLAQLFKPEKSPAGTLPGEIKVTIEKEKTEKEICSRQNQPIYDMLGDLSSKEKIDSVVSALTQIPIMGKCSEVHSTALRVFTKNNVLSEEYRFFLISSIPKIRSISGREENYFIYNSFSFFNLDGKSDEAEWATGLAALEKLMDSYAIDSYLDYFIAPGKIKNSNSVETDKKRIDKFISRLDEGKVGLPTPIDFETGFMELLDSLRKNSGLFLYAYRNYGTRISKDKRRKFNYYLKGAYKKEENTDKKASVLTEIIKYYKTADPTQQLGRDMIDFSRIFNDRNALPEHRKKFLKELENRFNEVLPLIDYSRDYKQRFCLENGLKCPGIIPSAEELGKKLLREEKNSDKRKAADLLETMGENAKPAEKYVIKVLHYIKDKRIKGGATSSLRKKCIIILGNIKTKDQRALEILSSLIEDRNVDIDNLKDTMVKIGKPAVPYIAKMLNHEKTDIKLKTVRIFKYMGKAAVSAKPMLLRLLKSSKDEFLNDKIEEVLEITGR